MDVPFNSSGQWTGSNWATSWCFGSFSQKSSSHRTPSSICAPALARRLRMGRGDVNCFDSYVQRICKNSTGFHRPPLSTLHKQGSRPVIGSASLYTRATRFGESITLPATFFWYPQIYLRSFAENTLRSGARRHSIALDGDPLVLPRRRALRYFSRGDR